MAADLPEFPSPLAEISHGPSAFEQFLDNNQRTLLALAVLVAIGAAGLVVYRGIEKSRQQTAGAELNKAGDMPSLQAVISGHKDTHAARSATILLADVQWKEGQQDASVTTLREFIDSNPQHPALATARASLASKLMFQEKNTDAAALYQQIADDPQSRYLAPYAMIALGDLAKAGGDTVKAQNYYNRSKTDFPESGFAGTASERISSLKAKAPVEVEPPPPAPATLAPNAAAPDAATFSPPVSIPPPPVPAPSQEPTLPPENEAAPPSETTPSTPEL